MVSRKLQTRKAKDQVNLMALETLDVIALPRCDISVARGDSQTPSTSQ